MLGLRPRNRSPWDPSAELVVGHPPRNAVVRRDRRHVRSVALMLAGPPSDDPRPLVPCVGAVVHDAAGRLLLIRRGHAPHAGRWSLPGGHIEAGESPAQAVEREVLEETGLRVRAGYEVGRIVLDGEGVRYDIVDLACSLADPADRAEPVAGDDASAAVFADAATLARLPCTPGLTDTLRAWHALPR